MNEKSLCGKCIYFGGFLDGKFYCDAFVPVPPCNGIPDKFVSGEEQHKKIEDGQFMNVVYDPKDDLPEM